MADSKQDIYIATKEVISKFIVQAFVLSELFAPDGQSGNLLTFKSMASQFSPGVIGRFVLTWRDA
jgi:hypothetical protein